MSELWDSIRRSADATVRAHEQLGSHLAPSVELQAELRAAARARGVDVDFVRCVGSELGAAVPTTVARWYAEVRTVRGVARQLVAPGADGADGCWRDAFRLLGVI